jgi:hypothetical protein
VSLEGHQKLNTDELRTVTMGSRALSPGEQLLRGSRLFSIPKPLRDAPTNTKMLAPKSSTMTKTFPQYQAITSPLSAREKGDWGFKRPFPVKTTLATTTPLIRIKEVDTVESVTDFNTASDHALSLEKFQEMRVVMSIPKSAGLKDKPDVSDTHIVSVFEEESDYTHLDKDKRPALRRWKFKGPWLANMTDGQLEQYIAKAVRPRRQEFAEVLKQRMVDETNSRRATAAMEAGKPVPRPIKASDIKDSEYLTYVRGLRNDVVALYEILAQFLDLAPLAVPKGFSKALSVYLGQSDKGTSPYGKTGPPPSHPSAGISYLRTSAVMENHPVYGPQAKQSPVLARVLYPRVNGAAAKLGVGGFVANAPAGDNEFNLWKPQRKMGRGEVLSGIRSLDTKTPGGAKCYVQPHSASVDSTGKVVLRVLESRPESEVVVKEGKGTATIYNDSAMARYTPKDEHVEQQLQQQQQQERQQVRMGRFAEALMPDTAEPAPAKDEKEVLGSSSSYGLSDTQEPKQE